MLVLCFSLLPFVLWYLNLGAEECLPALAGIALDTWLSLCLSKMTRWVGWGLNQ